MTSALPLHIAWSTRDWAHAISALPTEGPLPVRTVLVPTGRVAHALRRELFRAGQSDALAGTLFRPLHLAAEDVLREAGVRFTSGEQALRATRLAGLFREPLDLDYFDLSLLRTARGWEDAFASTIADLESAGLRPADLRARLADEARARDVTRIWQQIDEGAGASWTAARIVAEAALRLEEHPRLWPHPGIVLAPVATDLSQAAARFLRAIPGVELMLLTARPLRSRYLERVELLVGPDARRMLECSAVNRRDDREKAILDSYLFEPGDVLGDLSRPRSNGPDGTVHLEEHAGLDEEIDAAVRWVVREVMEHGTPLEDIAVLVPTRDHVVDLVAARLAALPSKDDQPFPVFVAGGAPLVSWAGGARALAVVRALRRHLPADGLVPVLTALDLTRADGAKERLSHERAMELAYGLGTLGGNAANPLGALDWAARLDAHQRRLESLPPPAADDQPGAPRDRDAANLLATIRAARPALDALVNVARLVCAGAPLGDVWTALRAFLAEHVVLDVGRFDVVARFDEAVAPLCADPHCTSLAGQDAVAVVDDVLRSLRIGNGRFGDPAVYVGTIDGALGLRFAAVRVMGLLEGVLPAQAREDPVLPDSVRSAIPELPRAEDRALAQLHGLDRVVRDAGCIVLSTPRLDARRVEREPSSVFIEAAAALGRPNAATGESGNASPVPDGRALRRDAFAPARREADAFRAANPVRPADWLDLVARGDASIPSSWRATGALDLGRIRALRSPESSAGPLDGLLGPDPDVLALLPGLTGERPTSASALKTLLECPHHFLLERVLGYRAPREPVAAGELDALTYGGLFHEVVEELYREQGALLCARERDLEHWHGVARAIAATRLDELLGAYPLTGKQVRAQQLSRLLRDLECFVEYEWRGAAREFRHVELPFGYAEPLSIDLEDGPLFVRGSIDRVDVEDGRTLLRDLKTGKAHPRSGDEAGPTHMRDLQLGIYGLVLRKLAGSQGLPDRIAAAYVHMDPHEPERAFREDFDALEVEARAWLSAARRLLASAAFPRTPRGKDCSYCAMTPVCGSDPYPRALAVLEETASVTAAFHRIKVGSSAAAGEGSEE